MRYSQPKEQMKPKNTHFDSGSLSLIASSKDRQTDTAIKHMRATFPVTPPDPAGITTEEFAAAVKLQPQSIRKRYSQTGSYYEVRPFKLPNGRLRWPTNAVMQLLNGRFKP